MSKKKKKTGASPPATPAKVAASHPPAPARPTRSSFASRLQVFGALLLLAGLAVAAYSNSFTAGWHFDDRFNITRNPYVWTHSLDADSLLRAMVQDRKQNRPFSNLTFALNYFFGQERVWGYHLVNLGLHLVATWLVFMVLHLVLRQIGLPERRRDLAAFLAAAVWCVHPIQTQAVTYIVQRQTVMASAFMLASLAAYLLARDADTARRKYVYFGLAGLSLILGAGSKEIALITPALILLYEFYFFQKFSLAALRRYAWVILAAGIALAGLLAVYLRPEMVASFLQGYRDMPFTLGQRLLTEPRILIQYLGLILCPLPSLLTLEHDPAVSTSLFQPWTTGPAILFWIVLIVAAVRYARRHPFLSFALFWFLGNLAIESSFLPLDLMFEHRLYLASLALITPLVAGAVFAIRRPAYTFACFALVLAALALGSRARNEVWHSDATLWRDAVEKAPLKSRTHINLGNVYLEAGQLDLADREYRRTVALNPKEFKGFEGLGIVAQKQGRFEDSIRNYNAAIAIRPLYPKAYCNRGNAYSDSSQYDLALADYDRALELDPLFIEAYYNRAVAYSRQGDYDRAVADCTHIIRLKPNYAPAYQARGKFYKHQGRLDLADADFNQARALDPSSPQNQ